MSHSERSDASAKAEINASISSDCCGVAVIMFMVLLFGFVLYPGRVVRIDVDQRYYGSNAWVGTLMYWNHVERAVAERRKSSWSLSREIVSPGDCLQRERGIPQARMNDVKQ